MSATSRPRWVTTFDNPTVAVGANQASIAASPTSREVGLALSHLKRLKNTMFGAGFAA
jgi:hypothetical protein